MKKEKTNETQNKEESEAGMMQNFVLTDFNKNAIFECYKLMKDYLHDDEVESEKCFSKMSEEVDKLKIAIPQEIYGKIDQFIGDNLAPIVYEPEETFKECYSDDIGFYNDRGQWEIRDDEGMKNLCKAFILKLFDIEDELEEFAMKELHPLLV